MFKFKSKEIQITEGVLWKNMLRFFFPILIGTFFQQLYNTVDAIVVGNYLGKEALAAVGGASGTLLSFFIDFFIGIAGGATVIIAQYFGAHDSDRVKRSVHTAIAFALCGGAFIMVIGILVTGPALRLLNTPEDVFPMSRTYMTVFFCGTIPNLIYNIGSGILRAVGDSKRPLYFLICACIINTILDVLFVTVFSMGVFGVALATILSQFVSAILVLFILFRTNASYRLVLREIRFYKDIMQRILRIGLPSGIQSTMYSVSNIMIQASINSFGTDAMAGWTAYGKLGGVFWMILNAFYTTVMTFSGQNFGARNYHRMRRTVRSGMVMTYIGSAIICGIFLLFGRYALNIFVTDEATLAYGMRVLYAMTPSYLLYIPIEIFSGGCRSTGDSFRPMIMTALGICGIRVVWLLTMVPAFHYIEMLVYSYTVSWAVTAILFLVYYFRGNWLRRFLPEGVSYESTLLPKKHRA